MTGDLYTIQQYVRFSCSERVAYCLIHLVIASLQFFLVQKESGSLIDYFLRSMQLAFIHRIGLYFRKFTTLGWVCGIQEKNTLGLQERSLK